jgi:hypothetical protein
VGRVNFGSIFLGGIIASVAFLCAELAVEGIVSAVFGYNEGELLREHFSNSRIRGTEYIIITLIGLFIFSVTSIWIYALLLPRFNSWIKTALVVSLIVLCIAYLPIINFVNLGLLPLTVFLMSFVFNLIEIPTAIIIGSAVYRIKD